MPVSGPAIFYQGDTGYDLRKVSQVWANDNPSLINVRFVDIPQAVRQLPKDAFEAAYQTYLDSIGGGGGGGPLALGGDLGGYTNNGYVKIVRGLSSTETYDGQGRLSTVTTALGTRTMNYNPDDTLASITGTGSYRNKTYTYENGDLVSVVVS